jgi:hypothetical protein
MDEKREAAIAFACERLAILPQLMKLDTRGIATILLAMGALGRTPKPLTAEAADRLVSVAMGNTCKRRRGTDAPVYARRDVFIIHLVDEISQNFGFSPTRNLATADVGQVESACSIVAEACTRLGIKNLGETAVAKIWQKRKEYKRFSDSLRGLFPAAPSVGS